MIVVPHVYNGKYHFGSRPTSPKSPRMVSHTDGFGTKSSCVHIQEDLKKPLCRACDGECRGIRFMYLGARGHGARGHLEVGFG